MSLINTFKLIDAVGNDDLNQITECLEIIANPIGYLEKFTDTNEGIKNLMLNASKVFNLMHKHRDSYIKYTQMTADEIDGVLKDIYQMELAFEAESDQQ